MSDKFFNPVEVPVILTAPAPEAGFVRIYGRGDNAYALFPDGEEKKLTGGVVVVPGTDRDVSFAEEAFAADVMNTRFTLEDGGAASDAIIFGPIVLQDDAVASDAAITLIATRSSDSLAASDAATSTILTRQNETAAISDTQEFAFVITDSAEISDASNTDMTAINWADVIEANTNFLTPENMIDLSEATAATFTAQRGPLSGVVTTTASIEVSLPDTSITPAPTVDSVELQWGWSTSLLGQNLGRAGNSVDVDFEYSLDNGSTFTNLETVTNTSGASDSTATIAATYAQTQALRFRVAGSVVSGTNTILNAGQSFGSFYARAVMNLTQTL